MTRPLKPAQPLHRHANDAIC